MRSRRARHGGCDGNRADLVRGPGRTVAPRRTLDPVQTIGSVAGHLRPECAEGFVETLTRMAAVVIFSAANPGQGGTHHVNERWPDYSAGLFGTRDYVALDCVRREVWDDENVEYWYAQNTLVFVASDRLDQYPRLRAEHGGANSRALSVVHPRKYRALMDWALGRYQDTGDY